MLLVIAAILTKEEENIEDNFCEKMIHFLTPFMIDNIKFDIKSASCTAIMLGIVFMGHPCTLSTRLVLLPYASS